MKRLLLVLALVLCFSFRSSAWCPTTVTPGTSGGAPASCPTWAAGTLLAWDGSGAINTDACKGGDTVLAGVNTGGVLSGSGVDTIWTGDADGDNLAWPVSASDIDHDAPAGITVWIEVRLHTNSVLTFLSEFVGDVENYAATLVGSTDSLTNHYKVNNVLEGSAGGSSIDDSGVVWITVGSSWKVGEAGNNCSVYSDGAGWAADIDLMDNSWVEAESTITLGGDVKTSGSTEYDITRFAVVGGFEDAAPPWD